MAWIDDHLAPDPNSGCFLWTGSVGSHGYGDLRWRGVPYTIPRLVLTLKRRPPEPGEHALHSCDNRLCGRIEHLRWGFPQDNTGDMLRRGRQRFSPEFLRMQQPGVPKREVRP